MSAIIEGGEIQQVVINGNILIKTMEKYLINTSSINRFNEKMILIESDAGYLDKSLNMELYQKLIKEGYQIKENEPVLVNCILQKWGVKNKNGRIYPKDVLVPEVDRYMEMVAANSAISEADHPESSVVSLHNVAHNIKKMWWGNGENANVLYGTLEIITSPGYHKMGICSMIGDKICEYLKRNIRLGISSRGVGTLKTVDGENIVQKDFELICFDLVASPSTPGAYLFPENPENTPKMNYNMMRESDIKTTGIITESQQKLLNKMNRFLL
jgi:hypothetical protein